MIKYKDKLEKRHVTEEMAALLYPMMHHMNEYSKNCTMVALRILADTDVEEGENDDAGN